MSWTTQTLLRNERLYGVSLQYRLSIDEPFQEVPGSLYTAGPDGETVRFGPLALPAAAHGAPYVQLLWRYHHLEGTSGPRPEIRLDDIFVGDLGAMGGGWVFF